jgi:hypothetical protein
VFGGPDAGGLAVGFPHPRTAVIKLVATSNLQVLLNEIGISSAMIPRCLNGYFTIKFGNSIAQFWCMRSVPRLCRRFFFCKTGGGA